VTQKYSKCFGHFLLLNNFWNFFSYFLRFKIFENFLSLFTVEKCYAGILTYQFLFFVTKNEKSSHVIMSFGKSKFDLKTIVFKRSYLFFLWAYFAVHGITNLLLWQGNSFCDIVVPTNVSELSTSDQTIAKQLKISPNPWFRFQLTLTVLDHFSYYFWKRRGFSINFRKTILYSINKTS
jgi:hypothetical protein